MRQNPHVWICGGPGSATTLVYPTAVQVFKIHQPYHESDHVLNIAYNILCGGHTLDDIELRRTDRVFLDALGTDSLPDPTTAGDFCRRFDADRMEALIRSSPLEKTRSPSNR